MHIHGTSLIAGTPAETAGATFRAFDPALGTEIAPDFHEASSGGRGRRDASGGGRVCRLPGQIR